MFSFFEKFQSKDVEEEENPSWLYPLLYTLLAIFIAVFSAFIGFWMSRKSSFVPGPVVSYVNRSSSQRPTVQNRLKKGTQQITNYFNRVRGIKKNKPPTADYYQANTGKWIQQPIGRHLTQENLNERNESFGGKRKKNISIKRRK
jgi:hypothetical protein